ncbi:hypothetical protein B0H13DRAFT_2674677 [Mycena leptocephala]|nr:hypothetical protein B0H13DRAFT_2674677 [Mycena leptocephala]
MRALNALPLDDDILSTTSSKRDTCSNCAAPGGLTLFIEANWHRLHIWPGELLKGWLKHSSEFSGSLAAAVVKHEGGSRRGMGLSLTCPGQPGMELWTTALSYASRAGQVLEDTYGVVPRRAGEGWCSLHYWLMLCLATD